MELFQEIVTFSGWGGNVPAPAVLDKYTENRRKCFTKTISHI